jgi:ribosomal protein S12 methylthiotransferase
VEGAAANELSNPVPDAVRDERRGRLMQLQESISSRRLARKKGSVQRVLVDECGPQGAVGRSSADAPEIDGVVHVAPDPRLKVGEFYDVIVESTDAHDLHARLA